MNEELINKILNRDVITRRCYLGAFARDELPIQPPYPSCFIINTHPRSKPGEHWLALYYSNNGFCSFFDSYGLPPSYYRLDSYLDSTSRDYTYNMRRLQGNSDFCGIYAILFLLYITRKKLNEFFKEFYFNFSKNDKKIYKILKSFS